MVNREVDSKPEKIVSYLTAHEFYNWLTDHPKIDNIQGFDIGRMSATDNRPHSYGTYVLDVDLLYARRKEINDWINGLIIWPFVLPEKGPQYVLYRYGTRGLKFYLAKPKMKFPVTSVKRFALVHNAKEVLCEVIDREWFVELLNGQ